MEYAELFYYMGQYKRLNRYQGEDRSTNDLRAIDREYNRGRKGRVVNGHRTCDQVYSRNSEKQIAKLYIFDGQEHRCMSKDRIANTHHTCEG